MIPTKAHPSRARSRSARRRLVAVVCGLVFYAACAPASQAPIYHCEYTLLGPSDNRVSGEARAEISGDVLKWFVKTFLHTEARRVTPYTESRYKILLHNKVGIVAADLHSEISKEFGSLVGAKILTIRTSDGAMREGTVQVDGVYDLSKGRCWAR
jgi:hypothetical protein